EGSGAVPRAPPSDAETRRQRHHRHVRAGRTGEVQWPSRVTLLTGTVGQRARSRFRTARLTLARPHDSVGQHAVVSILLASQNRLSVFTGRRCCSFGGSTTAASPGDQAPYNRSSGFTANRRVHRE